MLYKAVTFGLNGIEASLIEVEVDIIKGLPSFSIIGLPDSVIRESKDRIRSAIENSGFDFPPKNFIVNLAPASFKKQGSAYDLAIAISILRATGQVDSDLSSFAFIGELSLDGKLRSVTGVLSMCLAVHKSGIKKVIVPYENAVEASVLSDIDVYAVKDLKEVLSALNGKIKKQVYPGISKEHSSLLDFSHVYGQECAKRAVEIAVAGNHNIMLYGPPGSGKTFMAKCIPGIMPELSKGQAIDTTTIHSSYGILNKNDGLIVEPPFRSPHHTSSDASLVGGGKIPSVGEVSLSHNGVLFLDEFVEFKNNVLQSLRQPLEDHSVTISRAAGSYNFPADFMLVAACNPCQCGYLFDKEINCSCSDIQIKNYFKKISGPVLDRIDMEVYVPRVPYKKLLGGQSFESSIDIRKRIEAARKIQRERFISRDYYYNSRMTGEDIKIYCKLENESEVFFEKAIEKMNLSARSFFRILKVARTIADIEGVMNIERKHLAEALSYKNIQKYYKF